MANTDHDPRDDIDLAEPRREEFGQMMANRQEVLAPGIEHQLSPRQVGDLFGSVTTAQAVIRDRNIPALMQTLKALAISFGDNYTYSWDVKDKHSKRTDGKTTIEGPTIQLANDLAREFGNCCLDIREIEGPAHWVFYGRFIDLQTGYTLTRAFRQRKNALAGKYEDDRKLDMAYQMGQSKCLRNVVVNALRNYAEYMMEEAKRSITDKIEKDPKHFIEAIERGLTKFGIALQSAETMVGRARVEWGTRDIAKIFGALKAIAEGLADVSEVFPKDGAQIKDPAPKESGTASASTDQPGSTAKAAEAKGPATSTGKSPAGPDADEPKPEKEKEKEPAKKKPAPRPKALFDQE